MGKYMNYGKKLKIGMYAGSWPQNIGNAFFDFGAEAIIRQAFPNAELFRMGGAVHWMFNNSARTRFGLIGRAIRKFGPVHHPVNGNSIEIDAKKVPPQDSQLFLNCMAGFFWIWLAAHFTVPPPGVA